MTDLDLLQSWNSDWSKTKFLVFGLGVSGFAVADTLQELDAQLLVISDKATDENRDMLEVLGIASSIGASHAANLEMLAEFAPDVLVVSPGIRPDNEFLQAALNRSVTVWTDFDLAWRIRDKWGFSSQWLCITGTNGKTTVTQMVETIMRSAGIRAVACGNIGYSILDAIRDPAEFEALVVEMSSFQLHHTNYFEPLVSAVLNVADDHLDWHGSFDAYAAAKGKIYNNTKAVCVYNSRDEISYGLMKKSENTTQAQAVGFTRFTPTPNEIGWVEDILVDRAFVDTVDYADELATIGDLKKIPVISPHLLENVAAAAAIVRAAGVQPAEIAAGLGNFELDAHRIQLVLEKDGIQWVDDSKATNPHAADAALSSFDSVVWVVGGLLKGVDMSELIAKHSAKLKTAIIIGKERHQVLAALAQHSPGTQVFEVESELVMESVVGIASSVASSGDTVLLAPAAASMDQFIDYADRGNSFQAAVLKEHGNG